MVDGGAVGAGMARGAEGPPVKDPPGRLEGVLRAAEGLGLRWILPHTKPVYKGCQLVLHLH